MLLVRGILLPKYGQPGAFEVRQTTQEIWMELRDRFQAFKELSFLQTQVDTMQDKGQYLKLLWVLQFWAVESLPWLQNRLCTTAEVTLCRTGETAL